MPRVARTVRARLPHITLDLRGELLTPQLVDGLTAGTHDLAVLRIGVGQLTGLVEAVDDGFGGNPDGRHEEAGAGVNDDGGELVELALGVVVAGE